MACDGYSLHSLLDKFLEKSVMLCSCLRTVIQWEKQNRNLHLQRTLLKNTVVIEYLNQLKRKVIFHDLPRS